MSGTLLILTIAFLCLPAFGVIIACCRLWREWRSGLPIRPSDICGHVLGLVCSLFYPLTFSIALWNRAFPFSGRLCVLSTVGSSGATILFAISESPSKWLGFWCASFTAFLSPILLFV